MRFTIMNSFKPRKSAGLTSLVLAFLLASPAQAATSPSLGAASTFAILSSTYTNTVSGTTLTGDLGYTTGPAVAPTVNGGSTYVAPSSTYTAAGTAQGTALSALASQPCTFTFPAGAVDLATETTHGTVGVYTPGVYCTTASSAASIGAGGITLNGAGTYIFRINGALTTVSNSVVTASNGATACNVWWTPTGATTLGANSTFMGTDIDAAGITIGSTVAWTGRALAFGGTISTSTDTLTTPTCAAAPTPSATPSATPAAPSAPGFPGTGTGPQADDTLWISLIILITATVSATLYLRQNRRGIFPGR